MTEQWTRRKFCLALGALGAGASLGARASGKGTVPFKLGVITDEISQDLDEALEFIASYSLSYCELRTVGGKNIMSMSQPELEHAKQIIDKHHFQVSDIASPLYKWDLPGIPALPTQERGLFKAQLTEQDAEDALNKSFQIARLFGTDKVRIFSYWRVEDPTKAYPYVVKRLKKAVALAEQNKITLLLENEPSCNVGKGEELGRMLREIDSPWLRGNWDPANSVDLHEVPYPDGYNRVRGLFPHMHLKDLVPDKTGWTRYVPIGRGVVDFHGQFQALIKDGYHGTMSVETHYRRPDGNKKEATRECLDGLMKIFENLEARS
ncbi:MAG: sugar phosphate isomerase/epimerase [Acidobacteriota bacterium]|nr:sugar phosphate isomerase/epimerase [Acidobacteriota bacterium]